MMIFGSSLMLLTSPLLDLPFLSHSLVIMILYIWSRRNPHERLRLFGLFTIGAGYLSYVLLGLSILVGGSIIVDLLGILVGHIYFFLTDIIPEEYDIQILKTPFFM
jgi:Derlin-2/3